MKNNVRISECAVGVIRRIIFPAVNLFLIFWLAFVNAQEGFPLDGTWRGEWGPSAENRTSVVIIMKWDGETIIGMMNPGKNSYEFKSAELEPETWTVSIEAESPEGTPVKISGMLKNIGSYNRTIDGSWTQDGVESPFKLTRE